MNLSDVIEGLVEERGLDKESITAIVCEGILAAYEKKYPDIDFVVDVNKKTGKLEVFAEKEVVSSVADNDVEISVRKAKTLKPKVQIGDRINVPFDEPVGRIEIIAAKQFIAGKIRSLEQLAVYEEYKDRQGMVVSGLIHKRERAGWVIKVGDVMALLPRDNVDDSDLYKVGFQIKVLVKEVLQVSRGDYQIILDRASSEFVQKLIELEIPEVFEGIVEIKKIVRIPGYKTKAIVASSSKEIDPVGTCVGVGGARIKPILRELGREKIDLIEETDSLEELVKNSLKPADIDNVEIQEGEDKAVVWLAQDQRSLAIGKMGQNISLASKISGVEIQLQDLVEEEPEVSFYDDEDDKPAKEVEEEFDFQGIDEQE